MKRVIRGSFTTFSCGQKVITRSGVPSSIIIQSTCEYFAKLGGFRKTRNDVEKSSQRPQIRNASAASAIHVHQKKDGDVKNTNVIKQSPSSNHETNTSRNSFDLSETLVP
jgi:hypothetical protein